MSRGNQLYDRPDLTQQLGKLALYVTGTLPNAKVLLEYNQRLQIHNAIGACSVDVLEGVIPPGGQVYVDNATSEIVVAWPAYSETPSPPDNAGFEAGDLTGWTYSTTGGSGAPVVTNGQHNSGSYAAYWAGGKGLGSEGGIECVLLNDKACVAYPGQRINFKATILYNPGGGTPKGSRGQVRLNWYDADGELIDTSYGELIKTRAHNGKWTNSAGSEKGPPGTKSARLAVWLTATGAGHSYCDDATWDAPAIIGTKDDGTINLWLRVHDAGGRAADWKGRILVRGTPKWLIGPVNGGYLITADPLVLTGAVSAKPAGVGTIATVSSVNGAVYLHAGASSAVSFDDGNTWQLVSGTLPNFRILHNGNKFYTSSGRLCSVDGITFTAIPNLPAGATVGIVNPIDHTIAAYDQHYVYLSTDEGATWSKTYTLAGPTWSNRGEQMDISESGRIIWTGYDGNTNNRIYYSDTYGITQAISGQVAGSYGSRYSTEGVWLIKAYPDGYYRAVGNPGTLVLDGWTSARADNCFNYDKDGKWGVISPAAGGTFKTATSTDNALTWSTSPTVLTSYSAPMMTPMYPRYDE